MIPTKLTTTTTTTLQPPEEEVADVENTEATPQESVKNWDKPFWRSVLSNDYGTGSTARFSTVVVIVITMGLLVFLIVKDNKIPDDIMTLGYFSSLLVTVVYSPAKFADIMSQYFKKK